MGASVRIDKGVRIYQRGGIWHLALYRGGERFRRSLDTKDRALAKAMAKEYARRLANNESITPPSPTPTFAECAEQFLARKERNLRKGVLANYRTAIKAAKAVFGSKPIGSITRVAPCSQGHSPVNCETRLGTVQGATL